MQESHERGLRKELEAETIEDLLVSGLLSGSSPYTSFLKPVSPSMAPPTLGRTLQYQSQSKQCSTGRHTGQSEGANPLVDKSLLLKLCQGVN